MPPSDGSDAGELHALVVQKLRRVFGDSRAEVLLSELLSELSIERVATTDDLSRIAAALQTRGGFEATTGALLSVQAAMRRVNSG